MKNKIYSVINEFLDSYVIEGVNPQQFLNYLNTDEDNFKLIYHKIYRKLTIEGVSFESKELTECLVDSIRDKIALLNDLNQGKPALPETIITQHPANTLNEAIVWDGKYLQFGDKSYSSIPANNDDYSILFSNGTEEVKIYRQKDGKIYGDFNNYDKIFDNEIALIDFLNTNRYSYLGIEDE